MIHTDTPDYAHAARAMRERQARSEDQAHHAADEALRARGRGDHRVAALFNDLAAHHDRRAVIQYRAYRRLAAKAANYSEGDRITGQDGTRTADWGAGRVTRVAAGRLFVKWDGAEFTEDEVSPAEIRPA